MGKLSKLWAIAISLGTFFTALVVATPSAINISTQWVPVYKNGLNGETLAGSKNALFAAIRAGQPIQIAWGISREVEGKTRSVEHLIAPVFLTITDGTDVVAQLPEHIAQRGYWGSDKAFFDNGAVMWRGLMTTTGSFDAIWVNRGTGEVVRRAPQRAVMTWFAQQPVSPDTPSLAIPNGVTSDVSRADERYSK